MTPPPRLVHLSDLETLFDRPADAGRLAGAVEALHDDRTLVVGTGDTTALGSLALATEEGRGHARPFLEAVRPVADTFGNHDFDLGLEWAADWARGTPGTHLAANLDGIDTDAFEPSIVVDVGEARIGLVGVVNPETATICHAAGSLTFSDPVTAVREEAEALQRRGAEHVVVLSHCGEADADIARGADVDAVLGAHDHERVEEHVDGTLLARTRGGQANEYEVVTLDDEPTVEVRDATDGPVDEAVEREYRERRAAAGIDAGVCSFQRPLSQEEAGRAVADAYRSRGEADVGVLVSASVRGGLPATATTGDLLGVVPFDSHLQTLEVGGADLAAALRVGQDPLDDTHGRLYAAGATVDGDDPDEPVAIGGKPVDPDRTYRVACTSYLPSVELVPGFHPDAVVEDRGPQHEHLLAHARDGTFGNAGG